MRYQGVDLYPTATSGLLPARAHENSHTQRAAIGLHYLVKTYNTSSRALLGINFGQSWDTRYGVSFSDFSSLSFVESKTFWQVLAGVHLNIL